MSLGSNNFRNSRLAKFFFIISIIAFLYWFIGRTIDVYRFALVGAVWELLWIFMIMIQFALPVISLVFLIKEQFSLTSLYLYTLIISVSSILLMILA
jgi:hypothetical protein